MHELDLVRALMALVDLALRVLEFRRQRRTPPEQ